MNTREDYIWKYAKESHVIAPQRLKIACQCGRTHSSMFLHWEVKRFPCGRFYWAIRPTWDKTLELKIWPGNTRTGFTNQPNGTTTF